MPGALDLALDDARKLVNDMLEKHRAAAVPCIIGAVVEWAVAHGAAETVRGSLLNAVTLADELEVERRKGLS